MMDKKNINMPYRESDEYVRRIVSDATERAVSNSKTAKPVRAARVAAAAAAVFLMAAGGVTCYKLTADTRQLTVRTETSPVEEFLNGLTDEEVQMLSCYEIEEIALDEY